MDCSDNRQSDQIAKKKKNKKKKKKKIKITSYPGSHSLTHWVHPSRQAARSQPTREHNLQSHPLRLILPNSLGIKEEENQDTEYGSDFFLFVLFF